MKNKNAERGRMLAQQFNQQAEATQKEILLPVPGIPTDPKFKFQCIVRRVDVLSLIKGGKLPEYLATKMLGVKARNEAETDQAAGMLADELTLADLQGINAFKEAIAVESCLAPRLSLDEGPPEGQVSEEDADVVYIGKLDFKKELLSALYNYAANGSRDIEIATTQGGTTTMEAVETFPVGIPGAQLPDVGAGG